MGRAGIGVAAAAALLAGCAHVQVSSDVLDGVPDSERAPVLEARAHERQARDEVAVAEAALTAARSDATAAEARWRSHRKRVAAAQEALRIALESRDGSDAVSLHRELRDAQANAQAASAELHWRRERLKVAQTRLACARAHARTEEARVAKAEFEALVAHHDPRTEGFRTSDFDEAITQREREERAVAEDLAAQNDLAAPEQGVGGGGPPHS